MEALARKPTHYDPDAELVAAAQRDPRQFLALYERHFPRVHRYVRLRVHHQQAAEDITSKIFLTALDRIQRYRAEGCFGAWLFRIAQNEVQDSFKSRTEGPAEREALDALPDRDPGPESQALSGERFAALGRLLRTLGPDQQHLLALRFGTDLSAGEIGVIVGKSPEAVRVYLHRTIKELRLRYEDER